MTERRFACTQCGQCCNRPPEVELGETADLADVFAWQLIFRLYSLPQSLAGYVSPKQSREQAGVEYYESKRLLSAFAAHSYNAKAQVYGQVEERTFYLSISALALDPGLGTCPALADKRCSIYERRPLSCRSVPLHYSRGEAFGVGDLDAFTGYPGNQCDTGQTAPLVLRDGQVVDPALASARSAARTQAEADKRWKHAIFRAMKSSTAGLPSLTQVEQQAPFGVTVVPMTAAWLVAQQAGLLEREQVAGLIERQVAVLDRMAHLPGLSIDTQRSLATLRSACAAAL